MQDIREKIITNWIFLCSVFATTISDLKNMNSIKLSYFHFLVIFWFYLGTKCSASIVLTFKCFNFNKFPNTHLHSTCTNNQTIKKACITETGEKFWSDDNLSKFESLILIHFSLRIIFINETCFMTIGQVGAIRLGVSKALQNWEPDLRPALRSGMNLFVFLCWFIFLLVAMLYMCFRIDESLNYFVLKIDQSASWRGIQE